MMRCWSSYSMSWPAGALVRSATTTPAAVASSVIVTGLPWASRCTAVRIRCLPVCWSGPNRVSAMVLAKRSAVISGPFRAALLFRYRSGLPPVGQSSRAAGFGGIVSPWMGCPARAVSGERIAVAVLEGVDELAFLLELVDACVDAVAGTLQ